MVAKTLVSSVESKKSEVEKPPILSLSSLRRDILLKAISNAELQHRKQYLELGKQSLLKLEGRLKKDENGLYSENVVESKIYIHINGMLGVLYYLNGDKTASKEILKGLRKVKNKDDTYSLSTEDKEKNTVAMLSVSLLEYFAGNTDDAAKLASLKKTLKGNKGLYCSDSDIHTEHTYLNAIKGIAEYENNNLAEAAKQLELIEKNVPLGKRGVHGISTSNTLELPEVGYLITILKYYINGINDAESYLLKVQNIETKSLLSIINSGIVYFIMADMRSE